MSVHTRGVLFYQSFLHLDCLNFLLKSSVNTPAHV